MGFAEQLESGTVATGSSAAEVHSAVPVAPAKPPSEPPKIPPAAPKKPVAAAEVPAFATPKPTPQPVPAAKPEPANSPRRPLVPRGIWVTAAVVVALIVAGPPLVMVAAAFTYPFVILVGALAIWKIYDLFQTS
jgi:hypothetical protein